MRSKERQLVNAQKMKRDITRNVRLGRYFVEAKKVWLVSAKRYNTREGLIHFRRKDGVVKVYDK